MTKQEVIKYIDKLEWEAGQADKFFIERNELYIENHKLKNNWIKLKEWLSEQNFDDIDTLKVLDKMYEIECGDNDIRESY